MNRVAFKTVGCRLNQAETAQMAARFEAHGYTVVPVGSTCDVFIVHTCTITHQAEKDCERAIRSFKRTHPGAIAILAGCAVEVHGEDLRVRSGADLVVGQRDKLRIPELLRERGTPNPRQECEETNAPRQDTPLVPSFSTTRALVKVQDGCDFHCAYCIVPFTRHAPRSRPFDEIVGEIGALAEKGYREIVLTGANVGCYRDGSRRLLDILTAMETMPDVLRYRVSSIELTTVEREIIDFMAAGTKLCEYLHLPLQSGDDGVLAAMGRRYSVEAYRAHVTYAAATVPRLGLGTDLLVGLPGESEQAFDNTCRLVRELPFTNLHVFPYSKREGTRAATMPDQVEPQEKKRRVAVLKAIHEEKRMAFATSMVGQPVEVFVERLTPDDTGRGWTREYVEAEVSGAAATVNQVARVTATAYDGKVLCCSTRDAEALTDDENR